jgi:hypothetical protein
MRIGLLLQRRVLAALALSAALGIGLTACGSSSTSATAASGGSSTSSSNARYQARLNLAKCMRAHGVDIPDPSPNGGPPSAGEARTLRTAQSNPNFQSALKACAQYQRQAFNLSPAQRAQFQQALLKFAQCMRAHNVNVPDPTTSGGGGFGILRQIPASERNSPAFQSAAKACSTNLPFRPGARPGGGAPPGA